MSGRPPLRAVAVLVGLVGLAGLPACGRIGFDPQGAPDGGSAGDGGGGGGGGVPCSGGGNATCFSSATTLSPGGGGSLGNADLSQFANTRQSACGGASGPDFGVQFHALGASTYEFEVLASFDTILYAYDDQCGGADLGCDDAAGSGGDLLRLTLAADQRVVLVVDSKGRCGSFSIAYRSVMD